MIGRFLLLAHGRFIKFAYHDIVGEVKFGLFFTQGFDFVPKPNIDELTRSSTGLDVLPTVREVSKFQVRPTSYEPAELTDSNFGALKRFFSEKQTLIPSKEVNNVWGIFYYLIKGVIFSDISERNNDYSDTLVSGGGPFFVLEVPDYECAMLINILFYIYTYEPLAHLEGRRLWRGITIHNFAARFAHCSLIAPSALPKIME